MRIAWTSGEKPEASEPAFRRIRRPTIYGSLTMPGKHLLLTGDVGDTLVFVPGRVYHEGFYNYLDEG